MALPTIIKKTTLLLLIFCSTIVAQSQHSKVDSLLHILEQSRTDTAKITAYYHLTEYFLAKKSDSTLLYGNKGLKIAQKINDGKRSIHFLNALGNYHERNTDYKEAIKCYDKGLTIAKKLNDTEGFAKLYNNKGMVLIKQGNYEDALPLMIDALKAEEVLGNEFGMAQSYNNIGVIYFYQNNLKKATEYFELALKKQEEIGDAQTIKEAINNVGALYDYMKDYEKALEMYHKALDFNTKNNDKREMAVNLHNIAVAHFKLKNYQISENYHNRSIQLRQEIGDHNGLAISHFNYGELLFNNNKYNEAKSNFIKGLEIAEANDLKLTKQHLYGSLAKTYEHEKNYKKANEFLYKFIQTKDSILNKENSQIIADVEAKYQNEKKEKELVTARANIAERELRIQQKDNLIYGTVLLAIILGVIGYLLYNQQKLKNQQLKKENQLKDALAKIETQNKLQEQRLRISRDLHDNIGAQLTFIISSLDTIKYGIKEKNNQLSSKLHNISAFTTNTIFELRDTIWAMNKVSISFEDFFARISNFMTKAQEMSEKTNFTFSVDETINKTYIFSSIEGMNIYRIIQESVQNALKYAQAKNISVTITENNNTIDVAIQDDGIGFDQNTVELGNGLHNIKKRAKDLNAKIEVKSTINSGTQIILKLPKEEYQKAKKAS